MRDLQKYSPGNGGTFTQEKTGRLRSAMIVVVALLFAAGCVLLGVLIGRGTRNQREESLLWMLDTVEKNYREEVSGDELYDRLYDALALDRFCAHYTPEEYEEKMKQRDGKNAGYGVSFVTAEDGVRISRVIGNSPGDRAGVGKGMYVYRVNGEKPVSSAAALDLLSASEGAAELSCGYTADGSDAAVYTVSPEDYLAAYCTYADSEATYGFRGTERLVLTKTGEGVSALPADTAYIALLQFEGNAAAEFEACLKEMKARGRTNLVLDLRGNGGGYLSILCDIASHLLRNAEGSEPLVMQARYRSGETEDYCASGNDFSEYFGETSRISVLADENSASASEALMGALIDYGTCAFSDFYLRKGAGEARTFGKGVMQSHFIAPDGNVLLLTVANIYWPKSGRCIHGTGVTESDGAVGVFAPSLKGAEDTFLSAVCALLA